MDRFQSTPATRPDDGGQAIRFGRFDDSRFELLVANYWGGVLTIEDSTFTGNSAWQAGALVNDDSMAVTNTTLSHNSAHYVGGIVSFWSMTLSNSTLVGNSSHAREPEIQIPSSLYMALDNRSLGVQVKNIIVVEGGTELPHCVVHKKRLGRRRMDAARGELRRR